MDRPRVLVIDDDPSVLRWFERVLHATCEVVIASGRTAGLHLLEHDASFAVVISDLHLPGSDALNVLQEARRLLPDAARILLTDESTLRGAVGAVNQAGIFRLLVKPCVTATVVDAVGAGVRQFELARTEHVVLEQTLRGSIEALSEVFAMTQPAAFGRAMRLRRHVAELGERAGLEGTWEVEVAALLSQVGSISLPPATLDRWYHGLPLTAEEEQLIGTLPEIAERVIAHIPGLERVRTIILRQRESLALDPPLGARLLSVATEFDLLIAQGLSADLALATMEGRSGRFDTDLLREFRALRASTAPAAMVREMSLLDVEAGMVFGTDVTAPTGVLLIARGQRVTEHLRHRIRMHWCSLAAQLDVRMILPAVPAGEPADVAPVAA